MNITAETIINTLTTAELVNLYNEFCSAVNWSDNQIFDFDENTINEHFSDPWSALRSTHFGEINFSDDYFHFNGYGNIETLSSHEIETEPDWQACADWLNENTDIAENYGIEFEDEETDEEE